MYRISHRRSSSIWNHFITNKKLVRWEKSIKSGEMWAMTGKKKLKRWRKSRKVKAVRIFQSRNHLSYVSNIRLHEGLEAQGHLRQTVAKSSVWKARLAAQKGSPEIRAQTHIQTWGFSTFFNNFSLFFCLHLHDIGRTRTLKEEISQKV